MLFAALSIRHMTYCSCKIFNKCWIPKHFLNLTKFKFTFKFFKFFIDFFHNYAYPFCKAFDKDSLLLHQSEQNFIKLFFISILQFEKLMGTGYLCLRPLHSSFLNCCFGQCVCIQLQYTTI